MNPMETPTKPLAPIALAQIVTIVTNSTLNNTPQQLDRLCQTKLNPQDKAFVTSRSNVFSIQLLRLIPSNFAAEKTLR